MLVGVACMRLGDRMHSLLPAFLIQVVIDIYLAKQVQGKVAMEFTDLRTVHSKTVAQDILHAKCTIPPCQTNGR